jgi:predicted nucleotidyltransferase
VAAPERPLRAGEILEALSRGGVDFVLVGGIAVQAHGYIRATRDLDVIPRSSPANSRRLSNALAELEAEELGRRTPVVRYSTRHGRLDLVDFDADFDQLRDRALLVELDGFEVAVAGLDDLIRMKRAAGRPQDLTDIGALTRSDEELEREAREST